MLNESRHNLEESFPRLEMCSKYFLRIPADAFAVPEFPSEIYPFFMSIRTPGSSFEKCVNAGKGPVYQRVQVAFGIDLQSYVLIIPARLTPYFSAYFIRDYRYAMSCVILLLMKDMAPSRQVKCRNSTLTDVALSFIPFLFNCPICIVLLQGGMAHNGKLD